MVLNPFQLIGQRLAEVGAFDFLFPWMITSAMFYALFRKTKILGENAVGSNAAISIALSFFIWGYAISLPTMGLGSKLANFFTQFFVVSLVFLFGFIGAGIAFPDLNEALMRAFGKTNTMVFLFLGIAIIIFLFTSGLNEIFGLKGTLSSSSGVFIVLFLVIFGGMVIAVYPGRPQ